MGSPLCICDGYGKPGYNSAKTRGVEPFCLLCRDEILGLMHHLGSAHIGMHNLYSALGALQSNLYVLLVGLINIQSHTSVFPVYSTMIFIYIYIIEIDASPWFKTRHAPPKNIPNQHVSIHKPPKKSPPLCRSWPPGQALCTFPVTSYPPGNQHIPPWEKEHHLQKYLGRGYGVSTHRRLCLPRDPERHTTLHI